MNDPYGTFVDSAVGKRLAKARAYFGKQSERVRPGTYPFEVVKRVLVGRKLATHQLGETLLPKRIALPVFASDALSSVAYAPDEILLTLSLAGVAGFAFSWQIALGVSLVMLVVVLSYRQTVHAYPSGGGDYEVATVNLGRNAGLTVASALLVVEVDDRTDDLVRVLIQHGVAARAVGRLVEVELSDDGDYDRVRDAAADLGVGLLRLEQRRHRMAELFLAPAGGARA